MPAALRARARAHLLARPRRPAGARRRRRAARPADVWAALRRGDGDSRRRRARSPRRSGSPLVPDAARRARARRGDARDDRRPVPRHRRAGPDLATLHRLKTGCLFSASVALALWAPALPARAAAVARVRATSSGCSSRSSTTSSTATATSLDARRGRRAPARRRGRRAGAGAARRGRGGHDGAARDRRRARRAHRVSAVKKRLDVLLVERGLAESRAQAQALVIAGLVPGYRQAGPAGRRGAPSSTVERRPAVRLPRRREARARARRARRRPGRARLPRRRRLDRRLHRLLLQRGAARVIALDVGYGQLHPRLRGDPRVTVLERDERARRSTELPFAPQLVVCDVSFISVRRRCRRRCGSPRRAGRRSCSSSRSSRPAAATCGKGGVVRDPAVRARACCARSPRRRSAGGRASLGVVDSGLPGPKGNREFFLHLVQADRPDASR